MAGKSGRGRAERTAMRGEGRDARCGVEIEKERQQSPVT
jgi:hypothetical protein